MQPEKLSRPLLFAVLLLAALAVPQPADAHCDTVDGPVVGDARQALDTGDLTPLLKWLQPGGVPEVRAAFDHAREVRGLSPEAAALADRWFFETVVRVHRAGEGFGFTGLKPAGAPVAPVILAADRALERGTDEELVDLVLGDAEAGIRKRFAHARAARAHAEESVEAGRSYVAAYVELTHYLEKLHEIAAAHPGAHGDHAGGGSGVDPHAAHAGHD